MHSAVDYSLLGKQIISLIDLTSLDENDSPETIKALCRKANTAYGAVAAVCIYPEFVSLAVTELTGSAVKVATVANFPEGTQLLSAVSDSIAKSIDQGAQEIDVVFPYKQFIAGDEATAFAFVESCKGLCGPDILLKVIIESGALSSQQLSAAAELIINAGGDFIKTSTGKISQGATLESAEILLRAIAASGKSVGLKISGGVRSVEQATSYLKLAQGIMGEAWVTPQTFRIGASQLLDNVITLLGK